MQVKEKKKLEALLLVACERGLLGDAQRLVHLSGVHEFHSIRDAKGRTPMHLAAARGRTEVLDFLWSKAADMDVEDERGWTPLHLAAANGHATCVLLLIDKGGVCIDSSVDGITPLHVAACRGHADVVEALVHRGSQPPGGLTTKDLLRIGGDVARGLGDERTRRTRKENIKVRTHSTRGLDIARGWTVWTASALLCMLFFFFLMLW
jgi:hypothetical protein